MAEYLTRRDCEGSNIVDGTNDCGMTAKRMGMLAVRVRKMKKALTVKMETVTLIGKGRYYMICFECSVFEMNSKKSFLRRPFFL
jgi:hypothetical protein